MHDCCEPVKLLDGKPTLEIAHGKRRLENIGGMENVVNGVSHIASDGC